MEGWCVMSFGYNKCGVFVAHGMNCPHLADKDEACTCAATERTMHAAWRKRAEEAEAANAILRAECEAWRHRYDSKCPADAGTAAHTAYYTEAAKRLAEARAATDAAGALKGVE